MTVRPDLHLRTGNKGRVERAFGTCQDRWVKEFRLRGVSDRETANGCLEALIRDYNARFGREAPDRDAHRKVLHDAVELDLILCEHYSRKLSKNLALRFRGKEYQVTGAGKGRRLQGARVTVCASFSGTVTVLYEGRVLPVEEAREVIPPIPVEEGKTIRDWIDRIRTQPHQRPDWKPAPDHP